MRASDVSVNTFWKGEIQIKGTVEDRGEVYQAHVYVKGSQVFDYSCSCAAGTSGRNMCSHCKFLFEAYQEREKELVRTPVSTSQQVRFMIREYTNREIASLKGQGEEKVRLVPRLYLRKGSVGLGLSVGRGRLYVVKDILGFGESIERGAYVEYGKGLAFYHSLDAFEPECRPLASLVVELVHDYREVVEQTTKVYSGPVLKTLRLSAGARDRFFQLMAGRQVEVEDEKGAGGRVVFVRENPQFPVTVKREGMDGFGVSIPRELAAFRGEHFLYVRYRDGLYQCDDVYTRQLSIFLKYLLNLYESDTTVLINEKEMPQFYESVLKGLNQLNLVESDQVDLDGFSSEELRARFVFDSSGPYELSMEPSICYGEVSFDPLNPGKLSPGLCRDVPGEFKVSQTINKYFRHTDEERRELLIRDDDEAMYLLLTEGMEEFMALGQVVLSQSFCELKVLPPPKISLGIKTLDSWLELTIDAGEMSGAELASVLSEYNQKKKFFRMRNGQFLRMGEDGFLTVARLVESLGIGNRELQSKTLKLPRYRALYLDSLVKEGSDLSYYRDALFKGVVRGMKSVEDSDFEIPLTLKEILRGYQKVGYRWLRTLDSYGFGGILADDMGLGKTLQVIALLLDEKGRHKEIPLPSLIVCPASLVYNWESEIARFAPELETSVIAGGLAERKSLIGSIDGEKIVVTSYDLLKRDLDLYEGKRFRFQIIDEAQYIKNPSTQSARAVKAIEAVTKLALTGTPIENRLSELWSIFDYLMPGFLFGYQRFRALFEQPIVREQDGVALQNLHRMIGPFVLRRLKQDVLKELPDKLENVVYSMFEEKQKSLYAANASLLKAQLEAQEDMGFQGGKLQVLAELTKLRQICCDPSLHYGDYDGGSAKLETCMELLVSAVEAEHKILLFSQFTSMLDIISSRLGREGIDHYMLTGSTPKEERIKMVNAFQKDSVPVFLISLKAGGTGLNLTAADIVIHYDPWWNIAAQNQATDRTHRIGQDKQVTVFKLITKNTIEENILKLQEMKKSLAEQIITEGTVSLGSLSRQDLLDILGV